MAARIRTASRVRVRAFGRIHFGLANLSLSGGRVNGGAGIMVQPSCIQVTVERGGELAVYPEAYRSEVALLAAKLGVSAEFTVKIECDATMKWHYGMGYHTQLCLALATALAVVGNTKIEPSRLGQIVSRGGTSGIGIHGFWRGGVLVDGGRRRPVEPQTHRPSAAIASPEPTPLLLARSALPFGIVIAHAKGWPPVYGERERQLFSEFTPLAPEDANHAARLIFQDFASSVATADFGAFAESLEEIQTCGFKRLERRYRGELANSVTGAMTKSGLRGVGMSSWGPAWFGFARDREAASLAVGELQRCDLLERVWLADLAPSAQVQIDDGPFNPALEAIERAEFGRRHANATSNDA